MARWEEAHDALLDLYKWHNRPEAMASTKSRIG